MKFQDDISFQNIIVAKFQCPKFTNRAITQKISYDFFSIFHQSPFQRWPQWFIFFLLRYEFSIPNSEFRIPNFAFRKKKLCIEILFLEMPHQGPCTGWGKGSEIRTIQTIV